MKIDQLRKQLDDRHTAFKAIPIWQLLTVMVGISLLIIGLVILVSPISFAISVFDQLDPNTHNETVAFAYIMGVCGLFMASRPQSRFAPWCSLPYAIYLGSLWEYQTMQPAATRSFVGLTVSTSLYVCVLVGMMRDRP